MISPDHNMQQFRFDNVATGNTLSISAIEKEGQAWFVANEVCNALDIKNSRDALSRLDDDEKGVAISDTLGGKQQVSTINESGLYSLIFSSNKAAAKVFKKWITSVVIPSIRQHGGYINGQEALKAKDHAQTLQAIHQEAQRVGLNCAEEKEARSEAFRLMRGSPSYGPGGNPRRKKKGAGR